MYAPHRLPKTNRIMYRLIALLLLLALGLGSLPVEPALAAPLKAQCTTYYTVRSGDSLVRIANLYKIKWQNLAEANNIIAPYTIYVGQSLCIPKGKSGNNSGGPTTKAAYFNVLRNGDELVIRAYNFPTKSFYYVKVDDFKVAGTKWYKLGMLRTRKVNNVAVSFELPKDLRKAYYFYVCLKNAVTDVVTCKAVYAW